MYGLKISHARFPLNWDANKASPNNNNNTVLYFCTKYFLNASFPPYIYFTVQPSHLQIIIINNHPQNFPQKTHQALVGHKEIVHIFHLIKEGRILSTFQSLQKKIQVIAGYFLLNRQPGNGGMSRRRKPWNQGVQHSICGKTAHLKPTRTRAIPPDGKKPKEASAEIRF